MILVPASITIENAIATQKYEWKSKQKKSIYSRNYKRAFARITGSNFVKNLDKKERKDKQVNIMFYKKNNEWILRLERKKDKGNTLQTHFGSHPYLQLVLNKNLPKEIWKEHELSNKKSYTRPIKVEFNINEWKDIKLQPHDFLIEVEKHAKRLMKESLKKDFNIEFIPKGRDYDLELTSLKGNRFILAISSHKAKNKSRSKEKRKQKILMDIAKMLPIITKEKVFPIILSQPLEFNGSWSSTTDKYLNFYKEEFGFNFISTNFEKGWEQKILTKILEIDKNV